MATVTIEPRFGARGTTYAVKYRDPFLGQNRYYKTYKRKKDAQRAKQNLEALIDSGKVYEIEQDNPKRRPLTFAEIGEHCEKNWQERVAVGELSPSTKQGYTVQLGVLNREFGDKLMFEISEDEIKQYRMEVALNLSNVSSNRRMFVIKQVCKQALDMGAIKHDPAKKFKYLSEKKHERTRFLHREEILRLLKASMKTRAKHYLPAVILLGADFGAALQEIVDLRWSDIDFKKGTIQFFRTKNGVRRNMVLTRRCAEALQEWCDHLEKARHRRKIKNVKVDYVFCRLNGDRIKSFKKSWRSACRLAQIQDFHMHDLRHTFCSNLILAGAGLKDVKEMIGHKTLEMADRYSHLDNKRQKELQGRLEAHYEQAEN